jgi:dihydrofolate reductase
MEKSVIIISAMSENRVIGSGEGMPWSIPAEYEQYLRFVTGKPVVMGRRTYDIFGPDLPDSTTPIVVTRSERVAGVEVAGSLGDAVTSARRFDTDVFVAGGGSIYQQAVPVADKIYLSTIKGVFAGDTFFPEFNLGDWEVTEEREEPEFIFRKYHRHANNAS